MLRKLRSWRTQPIRPTPRSAAKTPAKVSHYLPTVEGLEERTLLASSLFLSGIPTALTAGVAQNLTVTAQNADGSTDTAYAGTLAFASSDAQAGLPSSYTFTPADQGVHTFNVTLKTAGTQSVTATDTGNNSITGAETGLSVSSNVASSLVVSGFPTPVSSGEANNITVTAKDAYGNTATGYVGLVHISSSDNQAILPTDFNFQAGDLGIHLLSATLKTVGTQSLTATDTANSSLTGSETGISVKPTWAHPELITLSFVPDGTVLTTGVGGTATSSLFSYMNGKYTTSQWQAAILSAAQTWAQSANINFDVVSDNGTDSGKGSYQQGDPGMGDIRIGAYNFGNNYLAGAFMAPPTNNYSIAGDFNLNTGKSLNIGTTYDIQTVALHELGHSLGLGHTTVSTAVMYPSYHGVNRSLSSIDVSNVQAVYGARQPDAYNVNPSTANTSFATAASLNGLIANQAAVVNNLSINSTTQAEYFTFTAPANTTNTLTVTAQSAGLSMFTPSLTVYAADQSTVLGSASSAVQYHGVTVSTTLGNVTPGQQYYVKVTGVDSSAFSTGAYALTLNFSSGANPSVSLANTKVFDGAILQSGGGLAMEGLSASSPGALKKTAVHLHPNLDYMAASPDQIPLSCLQHGGGCGCPACQMAATNVGGFTALQGQSGTDNAWMLWQGANNEKTPVSTAEDALLAAWSSAHPGNLPGSTGDCDAYFAAYQGMDNANSGLNFGG